MNRRTRRISAAALAVIGSATVTALLVTPANAQAPDVASWWNAANVGNGAPAPPVPPDVASGDLLIQGSNANGSAPTTPIGGAPVTSQAVAGLIFELPEGATVGQLTLKIDGTAPPSVSVVACKSTQTFAAVDNGAWSDVPPSDCSQTSAAKLSSDGGSLVFDDITKLVSNSRLAITLLPGALDRVVLKTPDDSALTVTSSSSTLGGSAPPLIVTSSGSRWVPRPRRAESAPSAAGCGRRTGAANCRQRSAASPVSAASGRSVKAKPPSSS